MSEFKNITVAELQALNAQGSICLVDVRTDAEIAQGYIQGAIKLPLHLLPARLQELDKSARLVFYCKMGGRSAQAAAFAAAQGFNDVYNLQGGVVAWAQAGAPLVHSDGV
ncbi:MAG: rhodanese-like domain-containing protein [Pseudomonadota bacterium]